MSRRVQRYTTTYHWVVLVSYSCLTLCDPLDCSPPGFSVYRILQARILNWVSISFSRGSSRSRNWTQVSLIAGRSFYSLSHQRNSKEATITIIEIHLEEQRVWAPHQAPQPRGPLLGRQDPRMFNFEGQEILPKRELGGLKGTHKISHALSSFVEAGI